MRVAQLIQTVDVQSGGTSTAFLNTLEALRLSPGLSVRAFAARPPPGDPAWGAIGPRPDEWVLAEGLGRAVRAGALGASVGAAVRQGEIDLLHIHGLWSPDLLSAARACLAAGVPYVWEPHGMLVREAYAQKRWKKELYMLAGMRRALCGAAGLVFVTEEERDHSVIPGGIPPGRSHVVPLPVAGAPLLAREGRGGFGESCAGFRSRARTRFGVPPDAPCVVFMGRLHPVKRVDLALEAAAKLRLERPDLKFLIVGGGETDELKRLGQRARALGLDAGCAVFAGWVKGEDKWLALGAGDVLTLNSVHENFGFVAPEALCVGTMPVLTSNLALAAEMKAAGVAVVCEPTAAALSAAWGEALNRNRMNGKGSDGGGAAIFEQGEKWVAANLSPRAVGERLERLYRGVLDARGAVHA